MRIAQVSPLFESVPPQLYGGTERIVACLTDELVRQGHEVTLFASADSHTAARLYPVCPRALRLDSSVRDPDAYQTLMIEKVLQQSATFDVIHFHIDHRYFPLSRYLKTPFVHTHHGRLDMPELLPLFSEFSEVPLVSISNAQRAPVPHLNWQATVYHGLPRNCVEFNPKRGDYLAFLGRVSPEKGLHLAVEIARRAGMPLKVAAKIDRHDIDFYESTIVPLLGSPGVEFLGEIGGRDKDALLRNAYALLFPIAWPEPFGLVMIEALAAGTPVIAYGRGSVPEIIAHGKTGWIVDGIDEAVAAVGKIPQLDRAACRRAFEERFSVERMTRDYLKVYANLVAQVKRRARAALA